MSEHGNTRCMLLLRGVNAAPRNGIGMPGLRRALERAGFAGVQTPFGVATSFFPPFDEAEPRLRRRGATATARS